MNPQLEQALAILKQKRDQMMSNLPDTNPLTNPQSMDLAMKLVMGGLTEPERGLFQIMKLGQGKMSANPKTYETLGQAKKAAKMIPKDWWKYLSIRNITPSK